MKLNKIKIGLVLLLIILLIGISNISYGASSFSITSGISSIEVGKSYTITIKASGLTGRFNVTSSSNVSVNCNSVWVENGVPDTTIKVTTKSAGKATVTVSPESVASASTGELVSLASKTDTVTVKEKSTSNSGSSSESDKTTNTIKPTFTSKNETVYATSQVNVRSSYSTSSSVLGTLNAGDSVTRTGIATKSVSGILWSKVTYNGKTAYISSSFLTTTKPEVKDEDDKKDEEEKSNNVNLKILEVTPTGLSPAFSNLTTEYTMTVGSDIDEIEVKAVAEDENAKVKISGNEDLKIGDNKILVKVTAEDKTEKTYTITVTKEEKEQLKLSELLIEGLPLDPEFDENVYEYSLSLDKSDVSELNITATSNKEGAEVEIVGNTDLKVGTNVVTILVKSSDEQEITTYQITVNVPEINASESVKNEDLYKYIGIGIAVLILIIIIVAVIRKRNKGEEDYGAYYGLYDAKTEENVNNINTISKEEIELDELPKLSEEDLPKSLRKDEIEEKKDIEMVEEKSDRSKKIDELYAISDEGNSKKRRGKHF